MPASSKKQLNYFKTIKAYKDGGMNGFLTKWKELYGKRPFPNQSYIDDIIKKSETIKYSDLEDFVSGIKGDVVLGDKKDIRVGYYALFKGSFAGGQNEFIGKINRVDNLNKIVNFNFQELYNKYGKRIVPLKRAKITDQNFQYMDFAYFDDIIKTGREIKDIAEIRPEINQLRQVVQEVLRSLVQVV